MPCSPGATRSPSSTTSRPGGRKTSTPLWPRARGWSSSTSATGPPWWSCAGGGAAGDLPPRRPDRRSQVRRRPRLRLLDQRGRHGQRAGGGPGRGPRRFVFVSTGGAIYGEGQGQELPLPESAPIAPMSPYGQSKFAAEGYLGLYERLYGLSGVSLRLGNVYGPRQDPLGEAGVIAIFCGGLRAGEPADGLRRRRARPATTYMWATWSRRRWPRPRPRRPARSTSARGSGRRPGAGRAARRAGGGRRLRARVRAGPRGRGPAHLDRPSARRAAGLEGRERSIETGLRQTSRWD